MDEFIGKVKTQYEKVLKWAFDQKRRLLNTLLLLFSDKDSYLIVNGSFRQKGWEPIKTNIGDDLNIFLLKGLTGKKIMNCNEYYHIVVPQNYMVIGSIIDWKANRRSVIWGSGCISGKDSLQRKPKQILAVRGKNTRQYLLSQGIECPETYGDPALLLPIVYNKEVSKRHKIGIVPHYIDLFGEKVRKIRSQYEDVLIIDVQHYSSWEVFIDTLRSCEMILSSSLHGLIISDAYNIPNVWIKLSDQVIGEDFKFYDYFSSVGRLSKPVMVDETVSLYEAISAVKDYERIYFDSKQLLKTCPFPIINMYNEKDK